ncbi:hypothetical protein B0H10DRAFT_1944150 [Mycena sp. CBHHK59/15]|nr:hypothetical protein B0H10DRAFT_1944150 [Mycena sp. CBHHK59/15]
MLDDPHAERLKLLRELSSKRTLKIACDRHLRTRRLSDRVLHVGPDAGTTTLRRREVERALTRARLPIPQARTYLVSIARFAGLWRTQSWSLLARAESDQVSFTIQQSGSGEYRGGISTSATLVEPASPREGERMVTVQGNMLVPEMGHADPTPLSQSETIELLELATAYSATQHANVASDVAVILQTQILASWRPLAPEKQRILLAKLRCHKRECACVPSPSSSTGHPANRWRNVWGGKHGANT